MKFCFVVDSYKPILDGVTRYFDGIIPVLVKYGHEVILVCPHIPGTKKIEKPYNGFTVFRCFNPGIYTTGYFAALPDRNLVRAIRESDFILIHSLATLGVIGGFIARFFRKKTGLFVHQDERIILQNVLKNPKWLTNFTVLLIAKIFYPVFIDVFFCATERFKGKLLDYFVPENKIYFTPLAIDTEYFSRNNYIYNIRERYSIPKDAIVAIYVGRISPEKNITNLIKAMDLALDEEPKLYALFVGKKTDMSLVNDKLKNKDRIIFTGFVPDKELPSFYCSADFFTSPSLNESSCFTVYEAMSCGLPVITSKYRHDKDIIDSENAILVRNILDPISIKKSILLLARDKNLRKKISYNSKKVIESRSWEFHAQKFLHGVNDAFK